MAQSLQELSALPASFSGRLIRGTLYVLTLLGGLFVSGNNTITGSSSLDIALDLCSGNFPWKRVLRFPCLVYTNPCTLRPPCSSSSSSSSSSISPVAWPPIYSWKMADVCVMNGSESLGEGSSLLDAGALQWAGDVNPIPVLETSSSTSPHSLRGCFLIHASKLHRGSISSSTHSFRYRAANVGMYAIL